jgi:hypothetical protein
MTSYSSGLYGVGKFGGIGTVPTTYSECLTLIRNEPNSLIKIALVGFLPSLRTGNPLYSEGLTTIKQEEDAEVKALLLTEIYQFLFDLTPEERAVFGYFDPGYVENDPGIVGNAFASYVGVYISQEGEYSGDYQHP